MNYNALSPTQPTSSSPDQVEVAEIFWYGCPHCFAFDPLLRSWVANKPEYVNFVRMPAVWNDVLRDARAHVLYGASARQERRDARGDLQRDPREAATCSTPRTSCATSSARFGVDAATSRTTWDSFAVHAKLQRADELGRRYSVCERPDDHHQRQIRDRRQHRRAATTSYSSSIDELAASEHSGK